MQTQTEFWQEVDTFANIHKLWDVFVAAKFGGYSILVGNHDEEKIEKLDSLIKEGGMPIGLICAKLEPGGLDGQQDSTVFVSTSSFR